MAKAVCTDKISVVPSHVDLIILMFMATVEGQLLARLAAMPYMKFPVALYRIFAATIYIITGTALMGVTLTDEMGVNKDVAAALMLLIAVTAFFFILSKIGGELINHNSKYKKFKGKKSFMRKTVVV